MNRKIIDINEISKRREENRHTYACYQVQNLQFVPSRTILLLFSIRKTMNKEQK